MRNLAAEAFAPTLLTLIVTVIAAILAYFMSKSTTRAALKIQPDIRRWLAPVRMTIAD